MSHHLPSRASGATGLRLLLATAMVWWGAALQTSAQVITNLQQLRQTVSAQAQAVGAVDLTVTVCAASRPKVGVVIVQDDSGVELLQLGSLALADWEQHMVPGGRIRLSSPAGLVRKREMGVELSAAPTVNIDGLHARAAGTGELFLPAGKIPLRLEWFNFWRYFALDVYWARSAEAPQLIADSNLWHAVRLETGDVRFEPGLRGECFEGAWVSLPDFQLLSVVKAGITPNFDVSFRSRDEGVGLRFTGYLEVPVAGRYQFTVWSDDGAMLFLGEPNYALTGLGRGVQPVAQTNRPLEVVAAAADLPRWTTVEGRVGFVSRQGEGIKFELGTDRHRVSVQLADAEGIQLDGLMNTRVRVRGLGRGVIAADQTLVLGKLFAASAADLFLWEAVGGQVDPTVPITSVAQVQSLPIESARQAQPVRLRGTVTGATRTSQEHWMSFQDDTRGIFVNLQAITNITPAFGEYWEVEGHSAAGDFAPIIRAEKLTRLGEGLLPVPVTPTWTELLNGSRDVQWVELQGLVVTVVSNTMRLYLPEGGLDVELDGLFESDLQPFQKAVVKIRGVLYAVWDATTREVRVGRVMMRNATLSVAVPAPADPFDAVVRTPRELLLFDAQASAFRPVKVRGQVVYADATKLFLDGDGTGLQLLPVTRPKVRPGDLVEAVGYPDIGRDQLVLREVLLRQTGVAPLPPPRKVDEAALTRNDLNATRVRLEGRVLGWHVAEGTPVLEMQSGSRLYLARVASGRAELPSLRPGSRLSLEGVYVGRGSIPGGEAGYASFELLLNSLADLVVLSQPSWWTLPRLLALVGVLLVILVVTVIWNTQLRRLVEQRTGQLQREIRERERVERQHALETERSRIARDLHDDLGAGLTEISVLASSGQLAPPDVPGAGGLFKSIGNRSRSLISALDVIVWAVDPEDNTLQSLTDYLTGYTNDFFSHTQIACRFKVPVSCPAITLDGRVRHDLLMVVKEALNNIVRHAEATEVEFRLVADAAGLEIDIADNGKGIAAPPPGGGHGLRNLSARLANLGGTCVVGLRPGGGTLVKIRFPFGTTSPPDNGG